MEAKIGVFICYCGGNISDYVDCEKVREAVSKEPGVVVAKTFMFTCSDAAQEEMIADIRQKGLNAIVIASCSPKLHLETFRNMARRAGLNPYTYVQVNIREQCSWAHTHHKEAATRKAIRLVRAGIAKARLSVPLEPIKVKTTPAVLVVGAGVAGMKAALALADMGLEVHVVEREKAAGGWVKEWARVFPSGRPGEELINTLLKGFEERKNIHLYLETEVVEKRGSVGQFQVRLKGPQGEQEVEVGAIVVATGFSPYVPKEGEFAYGASGVLTLQEFHALLKRGIEGRFVYAGREIKNVAFIYCVGSREKEERTFCSRYCCTAAVYLGLLLAETYPEVKQFHFYRDMRTYGKYEIFYHNCLEKGAIFLRFEPPDVPKVEVAGERFFIRVKDRLTGGEEVEVPADLVVLVTGMGLGPNENLVNVLKLPVGKDGFFNEVHPKLRPVETVIDGLFIAGACQGPKNIAESVTSGLAAAAKTGALLLQKELRLEPLVAHVLKDRCTGCGECVAACPYEALSLKEEDGKHIASLNPALCKGEGACVPVCPEEAIEIWGYGHEQIRSMIQGLCKEEL